MPAFTEYISLGRNCEGAYQIRRVLGRDSSSFFSWNVTSLDALEALIASRFSGILDWEKVSPHGNGALLNDPSYDYKFHSPFASGKFRDDPDYEQKVVAYEEKVRHLIDKFLRQRDSSENTAYFYKVEENIAQDAVRSRACRIRDLLANIHGTSPFSLIILQAKDRYEPQWDEVNIYNRYLKRLSHWSDATDGHVQSWDKVFREFRHVEPLRLAGF